MIDIATNARGFKIGTFEDRYGAMCSIQESSLATEFAIWLGVNDIEPKIMARDALELGIPIKQATGWVEYPIPDQVLITSRMHLTKKQAADLIPLLQKFVDTGELKAEADKVNDYE